MYVTGWLQDIFFDLRELSGSGPCTVGLGLRYFEKTKGTVNDATVPL